MAWSAGEGTRRFGGAAAEETVYAARAARLGLAFDPDPAIAPARIVGLAQAEIPAVAAAIRSGRVAQVGTGQDGFLLIAPDADREEDLGRTLAERPSLRTRLVMTTPTAIRRLLLETASQRLVEDADSRLRRLDPDFSARRIATRLQAAILAGSFATMAGMAWLHPGYAWLGLTAVASLLFFAIIVLRLLALRLVFTHWRLRPLPPLPDDPPIYTLLVRFDQIDWPRERLDIKLIAEARDAETIAAIEALALGPPYETIIVPDYGPRTKPKALAFALPLARGAYVTVYDAEDRPDAGQLREAHAALTARPGLGCVQAPLLIDNAGRNLLTASFALDYSAQFDGILPALAFLGLPLPLGGTSNHFRREVLEAVGGWDPYNVTEDADLGIRLARLGYHTAVTCKITWH